jgi:hypothetical protein
VAWARYPVDLAHNFVLADSGCNSAKGDRLPSCDHLGRWVERNRTWGSQIRAELEQQGILADLIASTRVTEWAYSQTQASGGLRKDIMIPPPALWREVLFPEATLP